MSVYTEIIIDTEKHELSSIGIYEAEFSRSCLDFFFEMKRLERAFEEVQNVLTRYISSSLC